MYFGEKIRKLRTDNGFSQEELAEKLYVTRTAVSKWETGKGYPSIESFKLLSDLFHVSIDDLISDDDIECKKALDDKRSRQFYWLAVAFLAVTFLGTLGAFLAHLPWLSVFSWVGTAGYVTCAFLSKPRYKRLELKKYLVPYILSRVVVLVIVILVAVLSVMAAL